MKGKRFFFHKVQLELNLQVDRETFDLLVGMLGVAANTEPVRSRMISIVEKSLKDRGICENTQDTFLQAYRIVEAMANALIDRGSFEGKINIIPGHYHRDGKTHTFENFKE